MDVLVIDYGMGNLGSVRRSLEECGARVIVSDNPKDIESVAKVVLPGVGAFADGMANLNKLGWVSAIYDAVKKERLPLLGICLGMQLLADKGYEGGETAGLGLVPGKVIRLEPDSPNTKIPHIGWNEVNQTKSDYIFNGIDDGTDFYFVHSYHFVSTDTEHILATTPFCNKFVSAVAAGNIIGVQFHPEKSGYPGLQLLENFLKI
ncbi:MAG: imidazole glycerol phosphate synthase, glutamine amidotransferase subunit [Planctomycetes bacterium RBG_16_43_13]|nr:MAG: imidazole glycerol phosphate synthase, glutamine amidotransferase subunit [Planctomycetes bacterium RBG_16_43_13]